MKAYLNAGIVPDKIFIVNPDGKLGGLFTGIYILAQLKKREKFEGGHEKEGKRRKRVIKHTLKYLYEA